MIPTINKFPIILLCSPRTGSTAISRNIAKRYNLTRFSELGHSIYHLKDDPESFRAHTISQRISFNHYIEQNRKDFILKVMAEEFINYYFHKYEYLLKNDDCFKIRLSRKSLVDQIASWYVAHTYNIWHHYEEKHEAYNVPINKIEIIHSIEVITASNFLAKTMPYKYDLECTYEDLGFIENSYSIDTGKNSVIYHKPQNYEMLKTIIKSLL